MNFNIPTQLIASITTVLLILPILTISLFGSYVLIRYGRSVKITMSVVLVYAIFTFTILFSLIALLSKLTNNVN